MNIIEVNYLAVILGAILSMFIGAIWYGPLFGKKWMEIIGFDPTNAVARKKMKKTAGILYGVQFLLVLFQVFVLALLIADNSMVNGIERSLWIWAAFVIPTMAGAVMWTNEVGKLKWARFLIQGGYQMVIFIMFGFILQIWK